MEELTRTKEKAVRIIFNGQTFLPGQYIEMDVIVRGLTGSSTPVLEVVNLYNRKQRFRASMVQHRDGHYKSGIAIDKFGDFEFIIRKGQHIHRSGRFIMIRAEKTEYQYSGINLKNLDRISSLGKGRIIRDIDDSLTGLRTERKIKFVEKHLYLLHNWVIMFFLVLLFSASIFLRWKRMK